MHWIPACAGMTAKAPHTSHPALTGTPPPTLSGLACPYGTLHPALRTPHFAPQRATTIPITFSNAPARIRQTYSPPG